MKTGMSLVELAAEIERQANTKADYVARTNTLTVQSNGHTEMAVGEQGRYEVGEIAHGHLAEQLQIPMPFYRRLRGEFPHLLDENVNTLLVARPDTERRMVRTLDGNVRALLSDRYRRLDHFDLATAVLPELLGEQQLQVASCAITESRLYLKVASPRLEREVRKGDVVQMGLLVSNSEVGMGGVKVEPFTVRLVCTNGMTHSDFGMRKNHVGRAISESDGDAFRYFADETLAADDTAFFLKVRDTIRGVLSEGMLDRIVDQMREAAGVKLEGSVEKTVEVLTQRKGLNQSEGNSILRHLIEGSDLSIWGLSNAVTRAAADVETYDRASELEALGGSLLALPAAEIHTLAAAA